MKKFTHQWLVNFPNIRIKQYFRGWVVETLITTWYGKESWKHIISVAGISSEPWYFKTYEGALEEAVKYFKWDLIEGTNFLSK